MSDDGLDARELAEVIVCVAKVVSFVLKHLPDWGPDLLELEDELLDIQQELR